MEIAVERYDLLCRAIQASSKVGSYNAQQDLEALNSLVDEDLLVLAREVNTNNFTDIYLSFRQELARFHEFSVFPKIAQRTLVAFGGSFSAGKSSLINALLEAQLMAVEVDPTTSLPAYIMHDEADRIVALNVHSKLIQLSNEEFSSLTHEEKELYGSEVSGALSAAFITKPSFPWKHLAFIDIPGYTGEKRSGLRNDSDISFTQLNGAQAIVWVVNIKQGTIAESDLSFLAQLDSAIPKLVVVTRMDQVIEDERQAILEGVSQALVTRGIKVEGVIPVSTLPHYADSLTPVIKVLDQLNQPQKLANFAHKFKNLFIRYQREIDSKARQAKKEFKSLQQLTLLVEKEANPIINELIDNNKNNMASLTKVSDALTQLQQTFFVKLKQIGDEINIPLPEPDEMELYEFKGSNLHEVYSELVKNGEIKVVESIKIKALEVSAIVKNMDKILRHSINNFNNKLLRDYNEISSSLNFEKLLRINTLSENKVQEILNKSLLLSNKENLLKSVSLETSMLAVLQN